MFSASTSVYEFIRVAGSRQDRWWLLRVGCPGLGFFQVPQRREGRIIVP